MAASGPIRGARYQPPSPYPPRTDLYEPFALAAVELPEGLMVMGQGAVGYTTDDLHVGCEVELVVEPLYCDETGEHTIWRWRPTTSSVTEALNETTR